jgi:hypothetical protein
LLVRTENEYHTFGERIMDSIEMARMGGLQRAKNLTPQQRIRQARKAAKARWLGHVAARKPVKIKVKRAA